MAGELVVICAPLLPIEVNGFYRRLRYLIAPLAGYRHIVFLTLERKQESLYYDYKDICFRFDPF